MVVSKADKWFSIYIRLRDADENGFATCCTCGRVKQWRSMDCGHFIKRQHMAGRFSEINCNTQCKHCNNFEQGNDAKYAEFIKMKYGEQAYLLLLASKNKPYKFMQFELDELEKIYKAKAQKISVEKQLVI